MPDSSSMDILTGKLIIGTLLFIRIMGFVAASPFFRSRSIPNQVKVFLGVLLAFSITTAFWTEQPQIEFHLWYMILLVMKEFFLGVAIGWVANGEQGQQGLLLTSTSVFIQLCCSMWMLTLPPLSVNLRK